ncbi:MAG: iron-containing alcohol dehydrogenase [Chloroflexi bacterium]|nr:iron-containing alcohol dehydrogenase [Chloroflexota bacterium]
MEPAQFRIPSLLHYGEGALAQLGEIAVQLGLSRVLLVTDAGIVELGIAGRAQALLESAGVQVSLFAGVEPDPTLANVEAGLVQLQRVGADGLVAVGGGSSIDCAKAIAVRQTNPEPLADFFDLFILGEPEGVLLELLDLFLLMKRAAGGRPHREAFLAKATRIPGVYVPSMFHAAHGGGSNAPARPVCRRISEPVRRSSAELRPALTRPVVPYLEALPDRGVVEVARDCGGSCRGCRAGSPCELPRRRSVEAVVDAIDALVRSCGYREIGLQAPDGDDYEPLMEIARAVRARYPVGELTLFLPPIQIPPDRPPDRALASAEMAFRMGWSGLRYRWVLGRPAGEGDRQIDIVQLVALTQETGRRILGRRPKVRVEASYHRPRPQMLSERSATMPPVDELQKLQTDLRKGLRKLGAHLSAPDPHATEVEAALAMGDRRVANVIFQAWRLGSTFDGWSQRFDSSRWDEAFRLAGLDPDLFIRRPRSDQETMPWSHIWSSGAGESTKPANDALPAACAEQPCPVCRYLEDDETPSPAAGAMADRC